MLLAPCRFYSQQLLQPLDMVKNNSSVAVCFTNGSCPEKPNTPGCVTVFCYPSLGLIVIQVTNDRSQSNLVLYLSVSGLRRRGTNNINGFYYVREGSLTLLFG